jgi:hypothetical protein
VIDRLRLKTESSTYDLTDVLIGEILGKKVCPYGIWKNDTILRIGVRLRARLFMLTIFIARCYLQILKCLAEATRISLAQSFSRNWSDRVSLDQTP